MRRLGALLVAGAVLIAAAPVFADGVPVEKRPTVTKKFKKKRPIRRPTVTIEETVPPVVAAPVAIMPPPPPPAAQALVWVPGRWVWNSPMNMYAWAPAMYLPPPTPEQSSALPLQRVGRWIGIDRVD